MPTIITYDPNDIQGQNPITIQTDQGSLQITDPNTARDFISIVNKKDPMGSPDLNNIKNHLVGMGVNIGDDFSLVETEPTAIGAEEVDVGVGGSPEVNPAQSPTQGTVGPGQEEADVDDELELSIPLDQSTEQIVEEIIKMNKNESQKWVEKQENHKKLVEERLNRIGSDDFIGEMATVLENETNDDSKAETSLGHNKNLDKPKDDDVDQDFEVEEKNNTTSQEIDADYADDIAASVDADTIDRPLGEDSPYMSQGVETYRVPEIVTPELSSPGTAVGDYSDPGQDDNVERKGWNKANYDESAGISEEEFDCLMEMDMDAEEEDEEETGPGGHVRDGTGPHGSGAGPGKGKGCSEDKEEKTKVNEYFFFNDPETDKSETDKSETDKSFRNNIDEVVVSFPNGFSWFKTEEWGGSGRFSLRDAKNNPHITLELDLNTGNLINARGKGNSEPSPKYQPYIDKFLNYYPKWGTEQNEI